MSIMLGTSLLPYTWVQLLVAGVLLLSFLCLLSILYNLFLHPLAHVPGPIWARATGIPSWWYAMHGKRHIWLWQLFQIYGVKVRIDPNAVLFCDHEAFSSIYSMKANVRRSEFYSAMARNSREDTTITTIDVAKHARKRKLLNLCFTEKLVRSASKFVITHVDRWNELLVEGNTGDSKWSTAMDLSTKIDGLVFDILGDLCFGTSFDMKEPGENPLKVIPHCVAEYMQVYYPMCRSPFLKLLLWLKPRGLDRLFEFITPPDVQSYNNFVYKSITNRIALQKQQAQTLDEEEKRQDMFYFLHEAKDPDTGLAAYDEDALRAESSLLIIAGTDTTAVSLSGIFFYLTGDQWRYNKLVDEILSTFSTAEEIVPGPKLQGCTYLRACIDEGMRLTPSGPCELPREVLKGGITVLGEHYPEGVILGTAAWVTSRSQEAFGDPEIFRPERWIVNESMGVTADDVAWAKKNFYPFLAGPGHCPGQNLALTEMSIVLARTLHRLDVRRAPGSNLGSGSPALGWGQRDKRQFQVTDAFISLREGPEVQFRKRA